MQKNEGVILDYGNFVGQKRSLHPRCFLERVVSAFFIGAEKYELQMRKKFRHFFIFFCPKKPSMKKNLMSFLGQNAAYEALLQFTKLWTLYLISVLRYRKSKINKSQVGARAKAQKYSRNNYWKH